MDNIAETFLLDSPEQLRAIADPLRMRIVERLVGKPMTLTQLGGDLGQTTAKMHYHVHEMERAGLVKLVEKRERGGVLEKYYRAVAKNFLVSDLLRFSNASEIAAPVNDLLAQMIEGVSQVFVRRAAHPDTPEPLALSSYVLRLTQEDVQQLRQQIKALVEPFHQSQNRPGEREWVLHLIAHTAPPPQDDRPEEQSSSQE
jgi:DNA-binding transcriptional ArsR family regulator